MIRDNSTLQGIERELTAYLMAQVEASKAKYLFPTFTSAVHFPTGTWEDLRQGEDNQIGDFISVGSAAVVKKTPQGEALMGKIPMFGNERLMNAEELKRLSNMSSTGANKDAFAYQYAYRQQLNIDGFYKLMEYNTFQMLANGYITLGGKNLASADLRYKIPAENETGVAVIDELTYNDVITFTRGKGITKAFASQNEIDLLGTDEQMQKQYAMIVGGLPSGAILGLDEINRVFEREGFKITLVPDFIKDGSNKIALWKKGVITFVGSDRVAVIGHSETPEAIDNPQNGGVRRMLGEYSLMSVIEYQTNPYSVSNRLETFAVPILADAENTYIMDSKVKNV